MLITVHTLLIEVVPFSESLLNVIFSFLKHFYMLVYRRNGEHPMLAHVEWWYFAFESVVFPQISEFIIDFLLVTGFQFKIEGLKLVQLFLEALIQGGKVVMLRTLMMKEYYNLIR